MQKQRGLFLILLNEKLNERGTPGYDYSKNLLRAILKQVQNEMGIEQGNAVTIPPERVKEFQQKFIEKSTAHIFNVIRGLKTHIGTLKTKENK